MIRDKCLLTEVSCLIRAEVAEEMAEQMTELEEAYSNAATRASQTTEAKYDQKWGNFTSSVSRHAGK